jgi:hypothetical protein
MSLALIHESAKEVRRLSIAGSTLAVGDFRLKKLIGPLEQAGTNVPVFAQVAKAIGDLVNSKETDSAAHLLNLSTLLNAILYTQGQTGTTGDFQELSVSGASSCTTRTAARVLKPIIEALTTSGGGRFEIVKGAVDRGAFNDLRLIEPSIRALDDSYPELADLVADKILPGYGPCVIPLLKPKLDLKGKRSDARRLTILHRLDPAGTIELCKAALEDGSPEVKVAAIACLGKHEECLPVLLDQTSSKNKTIRGAALEALAAHERPEITKLFTDLIKGKALDLLAKPLRATRNQEVLNSLLGEGKRVFGLLLKVDAEQLPRYSEILDCLQQRKDAEVEEFLLNCFRQCDKLAKLKAAKNSPITGADLMTSLATLLYIIASPKAFEALLEKRNVLPPAAFSQVLGSALCIWTPDKVYQEFAPLLEDKKGAGKEKSEELQRTIYAASYFNGFSVFGELVEVEPDSSDAQALKQVEWDPRWLDAAIKANQPAIVCRFARPGHKGAVSYLLKLLDAKTEIPTGLIIQALARGQYPKLSDCFVELVKKKTKRAQYLDWELQQLFSTARFLPVADLPKLDAFAATLDEKFVDPFLEALGPLRSAKPDPSDSSDGPSTAQ